MLVTLLMFSGVTSFVYAADKIPVTAAGQQQSGITSVSGKIADEAGIPVIGAAIVIKGTGIGTSSDSDGNFSIAGLANPKQVVLAVSLVGYQTKEVTVSTPAPVYIVLAERIQSLDDIVLIGYGTEKK
jgi:hypothetical protein